MNRMKDIEETIQEINSMSILCQSSLRNVDMVGKNNPSQDANYKSENPYALSGRKGFLIYKITPVNFH
ncbi:hypothetical protein [Jeotgalicoccus marinus]|uniref:hypothetical protein n=1 Tax=Jeotgalicoccus marinus TaxID=516700 RepID=UPI00047B265B|nr:hypothetical protein [Jeotgalicoccus marinus]